MNLAVQAAARIRRLLSSRLRLGWRQSDVLLAREYARGVARLERRLGKRLSGLFFPVEELTEGEANNPDILPELLSGPAGPNAITMGILRRYYSWAHLQDIGTSVALDNSMLYEPILRMFERGAYFDIHHGEIVFEGYAIPVSMWRSFSDPELEDLSDAALDRFDIQDHAKQ